MPPHSANSDGTPRRPSARRRFPLAVIFLAVLIDLIGYGMIVPLLPFYVQRVAPGATLVGVLSALYAAAQFLVGPTIGGLSDRYGRRPVLLFCLGGTALAYLLLATADNLALLTLALLLDGVTGGNLSIAQAYIADSTPPERRARGMGLIGAAFGLGLMVGPALGGLLSLAGLSAPALVAAAFALANVVFGLVALPESLPPERRRPPYPPGLPLLRRVTLAIGGYNPLSQLFSLLRTGAVRRLLGVILLLNLAFAGLYSNFPLFTAARFGWGTMDNAFFFAFVGVCAVLTQGVLLGWLQPRLGDQRLARGGMALMSAALACTGLAPAAWALYPTVALIAAGSGLAIPALTSILSQRVAAADQGRLMGGTAALLSLTMIAGPLLAGVSFDTLGAAAPYLIGAVLAAAALALLLIRN